MSNPTASPIDITLADTEYKLTPLSLKSLIALNQWVRADFVDTIRLSLAGQPSEVRDAEMAKVRIQSLGIQWGDPTGQLLMKTTGGTARLLLECLSPTTPSITFETCLALMQDSDAQQLFWERFAQAMSLNEGPTESGGEKKKNESRWKSYFSRLVTVCWKKKACSPPQSQI